MKDRYDVVIVGSGSAGRTAAETLIEKESGYSILLVDSEGLLPYKRTKISKSIAAGFQPEDFAVRPAQWFRSNNIHLSFAELRAINPDSHKVELLDDTGTREIGYGFLLLAVGAKPQLPFPVPGPERCSVLWTVSDGLKLARWLKDVQRLVIVGMGVLGVEVAYQAQLLNIQTTMLGRGTRPVGCFLDNPTASSLTRSLEDAGIHLEFGTEALSMAVHENGVVVESDRGSFYGDYAVIAAGALPRSSLAVAAGLKVGRGIVVDHSLRSSVPDIWAAGDCAEHPDGTVTGLWHSAQNQGRLAALSMLGESVANENPPFRLKCEVFGGYWFSAGPVNAEVVPGKLEAAESWDTGGILWRPRFAAGRLKALSAAAPQGMDKALAKKAQMAMMKGVAPNELRELLGLNL